MDSKPKRRCSWRSRRVVLAVVATLLSCAGPNASLDLAERPPAPTHAAMPRFDARSIVRTVHFAFRPAGGDFVGGDSRYTVRVQPDGAFGVTPFHHPGTGPVVRGTPVRLVTQSAARDGAVDMALATPTVAVTRDGRVEISRPEFREYVRNTPSGVEQSWTFPTRPRGAGDLRLRVGVTGATHGGQTAGGQHYRCAGGGLGIRYGNATWIDARGHRVSLPAEVQSGDIVLRVPAAVVDTAAYPAVLDPTIGPEQMVDAPTAGSAHEAQIAPRIAADDAGRVLVVWQDARGDTLDVLGARVKLSSPWPILLDPTGIVINNDEGAQASPDVAFGGGNFLVVWQHTPEGTMASDIRAARVDPMTGTALDVRGFDVAAAPADERWPTVASDGTNLR